MWLPRSSDRDVSPPPASDPDGFPEGRCAVQKRPADPLPTPRGSAGEVLHAASHWNRIGPQPDVRLFPVEPGEVGGRVDCQAAGSRLTLEPWAAVPVLRRELEARRAPNVPEAPTHAPLVAAKYR